MKFEIFKPQAFNEQGRVSIQGDAILPAMAEATIHDRLFVVCDGMGERAKSKMASTTVCSALSEYFFQTTCSDEPFTDEMLTEAFRQVVSQMNEKCPQGSSASLAMLYFHRHGCLAAHLGNCRIYHIRPKSHTLLYKSADNSTLIVPDSSKSVIPVCAHITNVQYGDYFLLLSQGAAEVLSDRHVMDIVCGKGDDELKIDLLKKDMSGTGDNHSAYLIRVSGVMHEALDEHLRDNEQMLMRQNKTVQVITPSPKQSVSPVSTSVSKPVSQAARPDRSTPVQEYPGDDEEKGGVPIIVWAALVTLAILAGALFYFGRQKKEPEPAPVKVEVKKDSVKKDTINVMELERNKVKKDTTKVVKPEKVPERAPERNDSTALLDSVPAVYTAPERQTDAEHRAEPVVPPAQHQEKENTTPAQTTPPPANPNQVTPRPVIPEDE